MRVLLLTDSLGCPREETCVSETWTDRIMTKWSGNGLVFYTYCIHGLSVSRIHLEYLREISPDVIIMQVGVVDACRRALGKYEFEVVSRIPVVSSIVKKICGKYHYFFTVVRNVHHCSQKKFFRILNQICEESIGSVYFIKIASPGNYLKEKFFRVEKDIPIYNSIAENISKLRIVDPYGNHNPDTFLLSDGHHLNLLGNELLYKAVDDIIDLEVKSKNRIANDRNLLDE